MNNKTNGKRFAQIFSDVFSPLLVPTYGMALTMWLTSLRALPERNRLIVTLIIAIITGLLPLTAILALRRMGKVDDNSVANRTQRPLPMSIATACYIGAALFLNSVHAPFWLQLFFYGAALATAIAIIITLKWKVSAHTTAMGGLVGLLLWFAVSGLADVNSMAMLSTGIIISGGVASCRMSLNRHTLSQVIAGFILGIVCTYGLLYFFYII